jgi:hypothetical protein
MRDWQVNPFYRGFRHLSFPFLVSWDFDFCPIPKGRTHMRAANGPSFPCVTRALPRLGDMALKVVKMGTQRAQMGRSMAHRPMSLASTTNW